MRRRTLAGVLMGLALELGAGGASAGKVEVPKLPTGCKLKQKTLDLGTDLTKALAHKKLKPLLYKQMKEDLVLADLEFLVNVRTFLAQPSLRLFDRIAAPIVNKELNPGGDTGFNDGVCLAAFFANFAAKLRNGDLKTKDGDVKSLVSWAGSQIRDSFAEPFSRWMATEAAKDVLRPGWRKRNQLAKKEQRKEQQYQETRKVQKVLLKSEGHLGKTFELGQNVQEVVKRRDVKKVKQQMERE